MLNASFNRILLLCAIIIAISFASCKKDRNNDMDIISAGPNVNFYALTSDSKILLLNAGNASTITSQVNVSVLQTGETLLGIDFRPATGQLYGIGSSSRIYVIDPKTGTARAIGAAAFTPALSGDLLTVSYLLLEVPAGYI